MKPCPNCRGEVPNDAEVCVICGWDFVTGVRPDGTSRSEKATAHPRPRPTGKTAILIAVALGALSVLLFLISLFVTTERYGEIDFEGVAFQWMLQLLAGAFFHLALLIGLTGYIVRAISYLPAESTKRK